MRNGRRQRDSKRSYARGLKQSLERSICPKCGEYGPHYVPPSLGEAGFFVCEVQMVRKDEPLESRPQLTKNLPSSGGGVAEGGLTDAVNPATGDSTDTKESVPEPNSNGDDSTSGGNSSSDEQA